MSHRRIELLRLRAGTAEYQLAGGDGEVACESLDFSAVHARPFLKWTGGKQWLAPVARQIAPHDLSGRYFEPFLGGGAVFFSLAPSRAVLADLNAELIACYESVRDGVDAVISELERYPYDREFFLKLRRSRPRSPTRIAARMIYLNKTAFNGMYRVNKRGEFNVPFGRYVNPTICQEDRLRRAAAALQQCELRPGDFAVATRSAERGDFVYFDPPYITGHQNNGFHKYNSQLFSWSDQVRLAQTAARLADRGVHVAVSNADHPSLRSLYQSFHATQVVRTSLINSDSGKRGLVPEAIYSSYSLLRRGS
jgi:DNA adenine methylase